MKLAPVLFIGTWLFVIAAALPASSDNEQEKVERGIPTTLAEEEHQYQTAQDANESGSLSRDKRHKKKTIIVNQYYDRPRYGQSYGWHHQGGYGGYGCRGYRCGGGYYGNGGYPGYGYGYNYGGSYYPGGGGYYGHGHGKGHGKFG